MLASLQRTRERFGLREFAEYEVEAVAGDMIKLKHAPGWHLARCFDVLLHEPCA